MGIEKRKGKRKKTMMMKTEMIQWKMLSKLFERGSTATGSPNKISANKCKIYHLSSPVPITCLRRTPLDNQRNLQDGTRFVIRQRIRKDLRHILGRLHQERIHSMKRQRIPKDRQDIRSKVQENILIVSQRLMGNVLQLHILASRRTILIQTLCTLEVMEVHQALFDLAYQQS
jgi:hypothetical protein